MKNLPTNDLRNWMSDWTDLDRVMERWMQGLAPARNLGTKDLATWSGYNPPCDVEETADLYTFTFDVPGLKDADIKVEVHDNRLYVTGERRDEYKEESGARRMVERYYGKFERVFALPKTVNEEAVEAFYDKGVLRIVVPKTKEGKKKTIAVKGAKDSH